MFGGGAGGHVGGEEDEEQDADADKDGGGPFVAESVEKEGESEESRGHDVGSDGLGFEAEKPEGGAKNAEPGTPG